MIGGYILPKRDSKFEESCKKKCQTQFHELVFDAGNYIAWFFYTNGNPIEVCVREDELLLIDGLPVIRDSENGYRLFTSSTDFSHSDRVTFESLIDNIVSNVNAIYVKVFQQNITVQFSSSRASGGRIWYTQPPGNNGIVLCDDFRQLMKFQKGEIDPKAICSIIKYSVSPDPITIIKNIKSVSCSHFGSFDTSKTDIKIKPYFKFDFSMVHGCDLRPTKDLLVESANFLKLQDPIMLLSGGVDSTLFAEYLHADNIKAFFLAFGENDPQIKYAQHAAQSTGVSLSVLFMQDTDLISTLENIAASYMHPFSDYSTIPTYFLINAIKQTCPEGGLVIDGTGADGCFGFGSLQRQTLFQLAHNQPRILKEVFSYFYNNYEIYRWNSKFTNILRLLASSDTDIQLGPLVNCRISSLFNRDIYHNEDIEHAFLDTFMACLENQSHNKGLSSKFTVGDILCSCRAMALKDFNVGQEPFLAIVYPYLWKDILLEQGNLSWKCKNNHGVIKWPLKKLLEEYWGKDIIYREKSGFRPPFADWLKQDEIYSYVREVILDPKASITSVIDSNNVRRLLDAMPGYTSISESILFFVWGLLFTELWLQKNFNQE